jgi:hypothetical protein
MFCSRNFIFQSPSFFKERGAAGAGGEFEKFTASYIICLMKNCAVKALFSILNRFFVQLLTGRSGLIYVIQSQAA